MHTLTTALFLISMGGAAQQPPSFRSEVNLVNFTAVVRSAAGVLLGNLNKTDFEVTEDGVPQAIQFFARETELPLSLGVIVDVSGSQEKFLKQHNQDVEAFLKTILRPSDQAFALCFGNRLRLVSDSTSSSSAIMDGLKYDAVYLSITEKLTTAGERRRALIVFSDGEENSSEHDLLDVVEAAQNTDTLVYCIRYTEMAHDKLTARNKYGTRVMHHLASLSGAADFDALTNRLDDVFTQIGDELRGMYQIGYVSNNGQPHDGSFRKVSIRCKQPEATVRAKSGYYAK